MHTTSRLSTPSRFATCQAAARFGITPIESHTPQGDCIIWLHDKTGRSFRTDDWPQSQPELDHICLKFNHLLAQHEPQAR